MLTAADIQQLRRDILGFSAGRFFYDGENGDIAYIAKDCDDRCCDCEQKLNADGDQDCSIALAEALDENVGAPLARMLSTLGPLLEELDRVMRERDSCVRAFNEQANARAFAAARDDGQLTDLENYLLDEADFNRSWADGRRGAGRNYGDDYKARRVELAEQRERWAAQLRALRAAG